MLVPLHLFNTIYLQSILFQNVINMQSGIGFIIGFINGALFVNFAYLHNLYTVVELHINIV